MPHRTYPSVSFRRPRLSEVCAAFVFLSLLSLSVSFAHAEIDLPMSTVFKGKPTFDRLVARADKENWHSLPLGERTVRVGLALAGTPL